MAPRLRRAELRGRDREHAEPVPTSMTRGPRGRVSAEARGTAGCCVMAGAEAVEGSMTMTRDVGLAARLKPGERLRRDVPWRRDDDAADADRVRSAWLPPRPVLVGDVDCAMRSLEQRSRPAASREARGQRAVAIGVHVSEEAARQQRRAADFASVDGAERLEVVESRVEQLEQVSPASGSRRTGRSTSRTGSSGRII